MHYYARYHKNKNGNIEMVYTTDDPNDPFVEGLTEISHEEFRSITGVGKGSESVPVSTLSDHLVGVFLKAKNSI